MKLEPQGGRNIILFPKGPLIGWYYHQSVAKLEDQRESDLNNFLTIGAATLVLSERLFYCQFSRELENNLIPLKLPITINYPSPMEFYFGLLSCCS